jgi:hypothetical protein
MPYNCDLYITTYDKRFNIKHNNHLKEEITTDASIRSVYGKYVKSLTIVNQDTFIEPYLRVGGKNYMFNGDLDRLFTIEKLCMIAYDVFRGECSRNNRHYDVIVKMKY